MKCYWINSVFRLLTFLKGDGRLGVIKKNTSRLISNNFVVFYRQLNKQNKKEHKEHVSTDIKT